ncbi:MAG: lysoplasmalogenase [Lachnospiraceae bacterium]|nr:lysoplasmalogenase [Lachnospiraceae bacterium]
MTYLIIIIPYLALLTFYVLLEKQKKFRPATTMKVILSAYASLACLYAAIQLNDYIYYIFAFGLICAVPADFFLQYIKKDLKKYRVGIYCFGAMHVCLIISFYLKYRVTFFEFAILAIFIAVLLYFQKIGKWKIGKEKIQLTIYTVLVTIMAAKAFSLYIIYPGNVTLAVSLGGLFFFISDLFLGIWAYSQRRFVFLALNRVIYFVGQLSLAFYVILLAMK